MARTIIIYLLLVMTSLLVGVTPVSAETGRKIDDLWDLSREQGQKFHNYVAALDRADRAGQARIDRALRQLRNARTKNARTYYRLEYVERRVLHVRDLAAGVIGIVKDNERYLKQASRLQRGSDQFRHSVQIKGMRVLLNMVTHHRQERPNQKTNGLIGETRDRLVLLTLSSLVTPPSVMNRDQKRSYELCRKGLYRCLDALRDELNYLERQMKTI